ncbi:MAG: AbrB/MazE/SpoVT family DNA-binding domain-containing protein [Gammaproteobacteria bacterium]|nr:AbrB/MazE/SpoVT family DNA-binding domain-containing protein [Gammaproteobacteria bacterium]
MKIAKIFKNGQSQVIRLPKEFRFKGDKVYIKKWGKSALLVSPINPWEPLFESLNKFSSDYMDER